MVTDSDPVIQMCETHIREGERRVLRQKELIAELELAGRHETARLARELLATITESLDLAKRHLAQERRMRDGLA
jgi:hypothetical protein